jgi:hypothetical protein
VYIKTNALSHSDPLWTQGRETTRPSSHKAASNPRQKVRRADADCLFRLQLWGVVKAERRTGQCSAVKHIILLCGTAML